MAVEQKGHCFAWKHVKPTAFECNFDAVKLHIEQDRDAWTFWVRHPMRGLIQDGVRYDTYLEAADAAENAAIESLTAHAV